MIQIVANLSMLFTEESFLNRFKKAADSGFRFVEIMSPIEADPVDIANATKDAGVHLLQFNMDAGDFAGGDRGIISIPQYKDRFRSGIEQITQLAKMLKVRQLNCLIGNKSDSASREQQIECLEENIKWAYPTFNENNLVFNIEVLSPMVSPYYLMKDYTELFSIVKRLSLPNLGVQYDIFHAQLMEGNIINTIKENLAYINHIQIADVPNRHEPGSGEINYKNVLSEIGKMGYDKYISLEYIPSQSTEDSLKWIPSESRVSMNPENLIL